MATMASTLKTVQGFLEYEELRHDLSSTDDRAKIVFGFGTDEITIGVAILIEEDGEFIQFRCIQMFENKQVLETKHKVALYEYLLLENYNRKLGTWCLDSSDGDLYMCINIPLESGELHISQIKRIWKTIQISMIDRYKEIESILKIGKITEVDGV